MVLKEYHDDRFPNRPKSDYRSAKTSNNAVAAMSLTVTSQTPAEVIFCFFSSSPFSFFHLHHPLGIKT